MTILFVEDDPFVLTMYRSRLQGEGFAVESAVDGLAAIELLPKIRPDAVVLDLMLPKLHGLEVLKFIRADVDLKATPVGALGGGRDQDAADGISGQQRQGDARLHFPGQGYGAVRARGVRDLLGRG